MDKEAVFIGRWVLQFSSTYLTFFNKRTKSSQPYLTAPIVKWRIMYTDKAKQIKNDYLFLLKTLNLGRFNFSNKKNIKLSKR